MTRCHYLTARCPSGCECWLHPAAVRAHLEAERCRRRPWVNDITETAIVRGVPAHLFLEWLPARCVSGPRPGSPPLSRLNGEEAIAVASPIPGVAPRRWLAAAQRAVEEHGPEIIVKAIDPGYFALLEDDFGAPGQLVTCPACGWTLEGRGLARHRAANTRCRWIRAASQVRQAWDMGWRDPFSLDPGTPLSWAELQRTVRWRNRIRIVAFPQWTAVLLSPREG